MFRIGMVDLDTSHPAAWLPLINGSGKAKVVAVWDGGQVRPPGYAEEFARAHDAKLCASLEEMVGLVDAAIVNSDNWDVHVERARPFAEAGKALLIDKPMVGKLRDVYRLQDLGRLNGGRIMGGSSLRYVPEIRRLKAEIGDQPITAVMASGPGDFFSYGIHTIEFALALTGPDVRSVRHLSDAPTELVLLDLTSGTRVVIEYGALAYGWQIMATGKFGGKYASAGTTGAESVYDALIESFLRMLETGQPDVSLAEHLAAIKVALAAGEARRTGRRVFLDTLTDDEGFDGLAHAREYREKQRQRN